MRIILAALLALTIPLATTAAPQSPPPPSLQEVTYCTSWTWVGTEYQYACLWVREESENSFMVQAYTRCAASIGTCTGWALRASCRINDAGKETVRIANSRRIEVEVDPVNCDQISGTNPSGSSATIVANGESVYTTQFSDSTAHWTEPDGQKCMSRSTGGSHENRSADLSGYIEDFDVDATTSIKTTQALREIFTCSQN